MIKDEINQHFKGLQDKLVARNTGHHLSDAMLMVKLTKLQKLEDSIMTCLEKAGEL